MLKKQQQKIKKQLWSRKATKFSTNNFNKSEILGR